MSDNSVEARIDSGWWSSIESASSTAGSLGEANVDFSGDAPTLQWNDNTIAFSRGGCSAARSAQIAGRYKVPAWPVIIEVSYSDNGLHMTYGDEETRAVSCYSETHLFS